MDELIGVILIAFATMLGLVGLWKIFDMVRGTIKGRRNQEYEASFDRLAHAFIQHKKDMERRMENMEAVVAQENETSRQSLNEPNRRSIEIDDQVSKEKSSHEGSTLSNNLRSK